MASEAPPMYECALTELLAEGVAEDVRPVLEQWIESPKAFAEAYEKLSRDSPAQAELARGLLPAGARAGGLRNDYLSLALREVAKSLDETPTPAALRHRRDKAWTPAVGEPCEGRYKAGEDGPSRRIPWYSGTIVDVAVGGHAADGEFRVRYDDGDEEDVCLTETAIPGLPWGTSDRPGEVWDLGGPILGGPRGVSCVLHDWMKNG